MISKYQQACRRMLVDMHIPDWDPAFLAKYDPSAMAALFECARLSAAMIYCKSHVGLCYWPTRTEKVHAGIGGRDVVGEIVSALRASDIAVCAYYSIVFDNWAVKTHPEWGQRPISGIDLRSIIRYGVCCPNNPECLGYEMAQLGDLLARYSFDAIFLDMIFWPVICACDHCRARFRAETGSEIPSTVDWTSPRWCEFQNTRERWIDELTANLAAKARSATPGIAVTHNLAPALANWLLAQPLAASRHDTFVAGDLYGDRVEQLVVSKMLLHLSETRPAEFMTSLCSDLSDHARLKSEGQMRMQAAAATALSSAFLFIDAIDPAGTVNPAAYDRVGRVFESTAPYEEFLGGEPIEDVAVYFSGHSQMDFAENGKPATSFTTSSRRYPHLDAVRGACRALQRAHIPFGVITRRQIAELDRFRAIVVPDVMRMDADEAAALRSYVRAGKRVYASRYSSLVGTDGTRHRDFLLADLFGASAEGEEQGAFVYLNPRDPAAARWIAPQRHLSVRVTGDPLRPPAPLCGVPRIRLRDGARALATLTLPFGYPARGSVNDHRWASIHSSPPWTDLEVPAVVANSHGAGRAIYSAAPIEAVDSEADERMFAGLVRSLLDERLSFSAQAHRAVWMAAFDQGDRGRVMASFLNCQVDLPPAPVPVAFSIRPPRGKRFSALRLAPDGRAIDFATDTDGSLRARLDSVGLMAMVIAEYR